MFGICHCFFYSACFTPNKAFLSFQLFNTSGTHFAGSWSRQYISIYNSSDDPMLVEASVSNDVNFSLDIPTSSTTLSSEDIETSHGFVVQTQSTVDIPIQFMATSLGASTHQATGQFMARMPFSTWRFQFRICQQCFHLEMYFEFFLATSAAAKCMHVYLMQKLVASWLILCSTWLVAIGAMWKLECRLLTKSLKWTLMQPWIRKRFTVFGRCHRSIT